MATSRQLTITIPGTPDKALSPNQGGDRRWKARTVKDLREQAGFIALAQRGTCGGGVIFDGPVEVTEQIVWAKGERRTDLDAVPLMCKPIIDGICDAQVMANDSQIRKLVVLDHGKDKTGIGCVIVTIREVES